MSQIELSSNTRVSDLDLSAIHMLLQQILADHQINRSVSCIFTDDDYIHNLNKTYRNIDKATDVLSFEMADPVHPDPDYLGEIYVSIDRARDQALEHHRPLQREVAHLVIHGILHLLGFEHDTEPGYKKMQEEEKKYLKLVSSLK